VQVYWTRKYWCHHRYNLETGEHWRCDRISNKEYDRRPRPGDLRVRRAMKRAVRQAARNSILDELSGIYRLGPRPGKKHTYAERREMDHQRERRRWEANRAYPYPHSRPGGWSDYDWEKTHDRWRKAGEKRRLELEIKRVEKRLESHPWEAARLPVLRQQLEQAGRAVPYRF
jgi:hypothetical protein